MNPPRLQRALRGHAIYLGALLFAVFCCAGLFWLTLDWLGAIDLAGAP